VNEWERANADLSAGSDPATNAAFDGLALAECVETYRRWLYLPDPGGVYVTLGGVAANLAPGADPFWLGVVGAPSTGKTEIIGPLATLPYVYPAATLTEPALLSGVPQRQRHNSAKGGLLREIGDFGILLCKDFTSILNQNRDARSQVLAALREIYDGSWTRHVGTDGGVTLHWSGKIGMVAGCTPTIDLHHAVMAAMGERLVLYRLPQTGTEEMATNALRHIGKEGRMRNELVRAVRSVLDTVDHGHKPNALTDPERRRLIDLADFAVKCRSAVERDGYSREVILQPQPEGPGRIVIALRYLLHGMAVIGVPEADRWRLLAQIASDSMPASRWTLLEHLVDRTGLTTTTEISEAVDMPSPTARRHLEDLTLLRATSKVGGASRGRPDQWKLTAWARRQWPDPSVPEKSGGVNG
jgi:hypothetical protein